MRARRVTGVLVALAATGCGGAARSSMTAPAPASAAELEAIYRARLDSARLRVSEADVRFFTGMIGHHAQALVMAALAPARAASPSILTLAARITNAQRDEIALMQRWLRERGRPVPEIHIEGTSLTIHGAPDHAGHMPGMLTPQQLEELERASGPAFDRLFLTFMIQHHEGAVTMVDQLVNTDGAALDQWVFKLAADIRVDQVTEVDRMRLMLRGMAQRAPGR